jgi:hypothetical protein
MQPSNDSEKAPPMKDPAAKTIADQRFCSSEKMDSREEGEKAVPDMRGNASAKNLGTVGTLLLPIQ